MNYLSKASLNPIKQHLAAFSSDGRSWTEVLLLCIGHQFTGVPRISLDPLVVEEERVVKGGQPFRDR